MSSTPIVNFFSSDDPEGSVPYLAAFVIGHCLFLLFNVINVSYLLLVQGFALGRLTKDVLLKLSFAGCLIQIGSCIASIIRWNTGEPQGPVWGMYSAVFGILATVPGNVVYLFLYFHRQGQAGIVHAGSAALVVLGVVLAGLSYMNWDVSLGSSHNFIYLIVFNGVSGLWHVFATWSYRSDRAKGEVEGVAASDGDAVDRILLVTILIDVISIGLGLFGPPVFQWAAPGMGYSATVLVAVFIGGTLTGGGSLPQYGAIGE